MITNFIQLDFNKENDLKVPSVQYDSGSRFVKIKLQRNKSPFEIDGYRVTVVANKVDGTEIMNDCTILDGVNGIVQFEITEQFNAVEGVVDCQLKLFKGETLLTSMPFSINVVKSVSTKEIVSSNELKTLVNALGEVQNIDNRFAQTNAQLSQKANVSEVVKRGQVTLDDCDSELLSAIHGGDGVEFNVLSIPRERSVDAGKLTADIAGYFNPVINEFVLGFIDVDGVVKVRDNFSITSTVVFFNAGTVLTVDNTNSVIHQVGLYENNEMVERIAVSAKEYVIPRSGYYRVQLYSNGMFEYTGKESEYVNKIKYSFDKTIVTNKNFNDYLDESIEQKMKDINIFLNGIKMTFYYGNINADGVFENPTPGTTNFYSDTIKASDFKSIKVQCNTAGYKVNYALYDNDDTFLGRGTWANSFELNNDKDCRLLLYFANGANELEEMLNNIDIDITPNVTTLKVITDELNDLKRKSVDLSYAGGIMSCVNEVKTIHTSFDDCWECFYQLQTQNPSSIYDLSFFNFLKTMHETYGAVFTVNCFNEYSGNTDYNLSNTPNTWKNEFQEAKDWLKFSFHAKDDKTKYAINTGIKDDYAKFINAIFAMTEDYECIDNFVRLGFYSGTEDQISQITYDNTENGIKGLLCADDDRLSYYFNKRVNDCVNKNGKYFDLNNNLVCVKTLPRFDSYSSNQLINIINENKRYSKNIEIFGHNTSLTTHQKTTIENMLKWANDNGYEHHFLMNIFNY